MSRFRVFLFVVCIANGCSINETESSLNIDDENTEESIINKMVEELRSASEWGDTKKIFSNYYYQPDSLLNGELRDYILDDFHYLWEYVNKYDGAFNEVFKVLKGRSLAESDFELYAQNTVCDECIVLLLRKDDWHLDFCIKEQKIYSTIGSFDIDNEEFLWFRTDKGSLIRFN